MKRMLAFALAMVMMLSLCACGGDKPKDNDADQGGESTTTTTTQVENTTTTAAEGTTTTTTDDAVADTTADTKAPTTATTTNTGTKAPTTTGTMAPTTTATTTTTTQVDNRPEIKILSIGHSFSVDAMKTYMWELFNAAGYKATIAYLYYPGCSLERHWHYIYENRNAYQQYAKNTNGQWVFKSNARALEALWDEDWDIVTFQPSPDYGAGASYPCEWGCNKNISSDYYHFNDMVSYVLDTLADPYNPCGSNTDVKVYYHLTWAFAEDCRLWSFGTYHNCDQMNMYNGFLDATKKYVLPNKTIQGVIPCITSIQNARTSWMGDTFNEPGNNDPNGDGYHLNDKGDLVAAMTWVAYFTGKKAMDFKIGTKYSDAEYKAFAEAVDNAIATWDAVTESSYKTKP